MAKVTLSAAVVVCLALAACGGDGDDGGAGGGGAKTFEGDSYSFTYPGEWNEFEPGDESAATVGDDRLLSEAVVGPTEGPSGLSVQVYRTNIPITEGNIGQAEDEFRDLGRELFRQADGRMKSAPTRVTVGGLPGVRFEGTLVNLDGIRVVAWITVAFDGRTEYFWDCEFTPEQADEVKQGCQQAVESFQVE